MPRRSATNDLLLRQRWHHWFSNTVDSLPVSEETHNAHGKLVNSKLSKAIGGIADGRIAKWRKLCAGDAPMDPDVAFRVGVTLSRLGATHSDASVAVLAAGLIPDFLHYLRTLSYEAPSEAVAIFVNSPVECGMIDMTAAQDRIFAIGLQDSLIEAGAKSLDEQMQRNTGLSSNEFVTPYCGPGSVYVPRSFQAATLAEAAWEQRKRPQKQKAKLADRLIIAAIDLDRSLSRGQMSQNEALPIIWRVLALWAMQVDRETLLQSQETLFAFIGDPLTEARILSSRVKKYVEALWEGREQYGQRGLVSDELATTG